MDSISALTSALAMNSLAPAAADPATGAAAAAGDIGPAATLMLSSLNLDVQMVSTLFGTSPLGRHIDALA